MRGYFQRVENRWMGWRHDAFIRFVWWRDYPALVWFALFGPRDAGGWWYDELTYMPPRTWEKETRNE